MIGNMEGKRKDGFLMFPRFLQLIFNSKYPELERKGETLDLKSLGSNTFGLMKQNRKGKFIFYGKYPLVKFGPFTEVSDATESGESSDTKETEDVVNIALEQEEEPVPLVFIIAEEPVPVTNEKANEDEDAEDVDESDFERGLMDSVVDEADDEDFMDLGGDLYGYDNDDLFFGIEQSHDVRLSNEDLDAFLTVSMMLHKLQRRQREMMMFSRQCIQLLLRWMTLQLIWIQLQGFLHFLLIFQYPCHMKVI